MRKEVGENMEEKNKIIAWENWQQLEKMLSFFLYSFIMKIIHGVVFFFFIVLFFERKSENNVINCGKISYDFNFNFLFN